jgi:hypothetical protein
MAQGKKTDKQTIYNIMASYFETRSFAQTSKDLDIPISTVEKLVKEHINDKEFVELWNRKKEDFVNKVDVVIYQAIDRLIKEMDKQENIPINQLTTAIGTLYDKKMMAQTGVMGNDTPSVQINIVDNSNLESTLYEEEQ